MYKKSGKKWRRERGDEGLKGKETNEKEECRRGRRRRIEGGEKRREEGKSEGTGIARRL